MLSLFRSKPKQLTKLEETEDGVSVHDQLRTILADKKTGERLLQQLKKWDEARDGFASRKEFRRGLRYLGYDAPTDQSNKMWDELLGGGKKHGEVQFDALKQALDLLGGAPPAAPADAHTAALPPSIPENNALAALAAAPAPKLKSAKRVVIVGGPSGALSARVTSQERATAAAPPHRPPSKLMFQQAALPGSLASASPAAMRRALNSVSPALVRAATYTAVHGLAAVSPAMVRATHDAATRVPGVVPLSITSPLSPGKGVGLGSKRSPAVRAGALAGGPLSAKSTNHLDLWARLALEEMNEVDL